VFYGVEVGISHESVATARRQRFRVVHHPPRKKGESLVVSDLGNDPVNYIRFSDKPNEIVVLCSRPDSGV